MKALAISDTHGLHHQLNLPETDLIIHAGDFTKRGTRDEVEDFMSWFSKQDATYKILIAGNHDFYMEQQSKEQVMKSIPQGIIYLDDSGVELAGIKIWGSPVQPWFYDWAFNRRPGAEIQKHWDKIPNNTEVLITHGPVYGILDQTVHGKKAGCPDLLQKIQDMPSLCFHICGHIHEAHGVLQKGATTFVNASTLNYQYQIHNKPVLFDLTGLKNSA